ncbi:RluA family pseudouridine synthase [Aeoliella mucimassa]|uniref:Ribosomal large subunit pseudouridine synthase A n=1 Tax=Aeoliella mucimassa TaxID=2527972 RepID=A0A518AP41_9BACT|nr:RluA family pseudouridine synthase [Aeoliella mucimassa]QDU56484.1 Ribosomal large subunit pseudouridine synthase A [Aeoliella mucimassa]
MLSVLYEDNHLLVVNKPPGLPTMGVAEHKPSLLAEAREYIRQKYQKPGNVYLGVVSRLDAPVTGVLLIARTSKAASRLTEAFRTRAVDKTYLALVAGHPSPDQGELEHYLRKDERHRKMHTTTETAEGAQLARLHYQVLAEQRDTSLVQVTLLTGRKHQIRVQFAKQGHPIVGDRKYGSTMPFAQGIALHSYRLRFTHPVQKEPMEISAPLPEWWPPLPDCL